MDIRPLLYLWVNKPDTMDDATDHEGCKMRCQTYAQGAGIETLFGRCDGYITPKWGNPYGMIDLWLDLDKMICNLDGCVLLDLHRYYTSVQDIDNWEDWPNPSYLITKHFHVIAHAILELREKEHD